MGNRLSDQEEEAAVAELNLLSEAAKGWLSHHMRNGLQKCLFSNGKHTREAVNHIVEDLSKFGC